MSKLIERLCKKIKDELGYECEPSTFKRTYAGYWQRSEGAWSWFIRTKNKIELGCAEPVKECVKRKYILTLSAYDSEIYLELRRDLNTKH